MWVSHTWHMTNWSPESFVVVDTQGDGCRRLELNRNLQSIHDHKEMEIQKDKFRKKRERKENF